MNDSERSPDVASRLIFLFLAQDERSVLGRSLEAVKAQMIKGDELHVVADNCHDRTADIARAHGAIVTERHTPGPTGKAAALKWWVKRHHYDAQCPIVILDADSVILPGFALEIRQVLNSSVGAVQAVLVAESDNDTGIARLIGFSQRMDQGFSDRLRSWFGGSVRLRGTGMALRFGLLRKYAPLLSTKTEDIELTLLLLMDGIKVLPAFSAKLIDPKPGIPEGAMNQRARWIQGQVDILRRYPANIAKLMFQNPRGFILISSALLKPRSIFSGLRLATTLAVISGLIMRSLPTGWIITAGVAGVAINLPDMLGLGYTLWKAPDRKGDILALLRYPSFVFLWLRSILRAWLSRSPWLRARPSYVNTGLNETASAPN